MEKIKRYAKELLSDSIYLKIIYLVLIYLLTITFFRSFFDGLVKIILIYGAVFLIYDLFTKRKFMNAKYSKLLLAFLVLYGVSIIVNYRQESLKQNIIIFCYTVVSLLILYPLSQELDKAKAVKQLSLFCLLFVFLTFLSSLASLLTYFLDINFTYNYLGKTIYIGVVNNRLWGILPNPNTLSISAGLSIMASVLYKVCSDHCKNRCKIFLIVNIVIQAIIIMLTGSRGGELFLFSALGVYLFFSRDKIVALFTKKSISNIKKCCVSIVLFVVIFFSYFTFNMPIKKALAFVPYTASTIKFNLSDKSDEAVTPPKNKEDFTPLDRVSDENTDFTSGRIKIWKYGLERFLEHPLFGVTTEGLNKVVIVDGIPPQHLHNMYIQVLASNGIFSFLVFMIFKLIIIFRSLKYLFIEKVRDKEYYMIAVLFAIAVGIMFHQLAEVDELYRVEMFPVVSWTLLGYLVYFLPNRKIAK